MTGFYFWVKYESKSNSDLIVKKTKKAYMGWKHLLKNHMWAVSVNKALYLILSVFFNVKTA